MVRLATQPWLVSTSRSIVDLETTAGARESADTEPVTDSGTAPAGTPVAPDDPVPALALRPGSPGCWRTISIYPSVPTTSAALAATATDTPPGGKFLPE
jgi:hypothetical protein